jgi:DNA-binding NarL/FixJ family response regulator
MVNQPQEWGWSSCRETGYACKVSRFLTVDWILGQFANQQDVARKGYREFVAASVEVMDESSSKKLVGQVIFGGADFILDRQSRICEAKEIGEIPRAQRFAGRPSLKNIFPFEIPKNKTLRNEQIKIAHISYGYTLKAIAEHLKTHYTTVSKRVKK